MLERNPGAAIVYNLICSRACRRRSPPRAGGRSALASATPTSRRRCGQEDAVFGGEHSGHFYFRDNWYADCGMAALLTVLEMVSEAGQPLSAVIAPLDHRFRSGEINSEVADAAASCWRSRSTTG